jgi:hypothetical protein
MTDAASWYKLLPTYVEVASHDRVDHSNEDCREKHLHRHLVDFRNNTRAVLGCNDLMRAEALAVGIKGKRLTYRRPRGIAQQRALSAKQDDSALA